MSAKLYTDNQVKDILDYQEKFRISYNILTNKSFSLEFKQEQAIDVFDNILPEYRKKLSLGLKNDSHTSGISGKLEDECIKILNQN